MINTNNYKIIFSDNVNEEIKKCLNVLFSTPVGTVVFDRDLGFEISVLDLPLPLAKAHLTADYINKVRKFEPRVKVTSVTFETDAETGTLYPVIKVDSNE